MTPSGTRRCLEKELNLQAEERRERARRLGIDWKIAERHEPSRHHRAFCVINRDVGNLLNQYEVSENKPPKETAPR
jgi:hypothetical protein